MEVESLTFREVGIDGNFLEDGTKFGGKEFVIVRRALVGVSRKIGDGRGDAEYSIAPSSVSLAKRAHMACCRS